MAIGVCGVTPPRKNLIQKLGVLACGVALLANK